MAGSTTHHRKTRRRLAALAVSTALGTTLGLSTGAVAQQTTTAPALRSFDIPAQPLPDALPQFGRQAGLQISAHGDLVRQARTGGVSGTMSPDAALRQLLAGTGLGFRLDDGTAVIVEAADGAAATVLDPMLVQGAVSRDIRAGAADRASSITIGPETLERRNPTTLKDVFAGEATVSVGGGQPLSQKVYVQGVEETNLAVSIDGARQNNKVFHHTGTNLIDPALLKAVRVDPGVAPADAGPGALGGAIVYETVDVDDVLAPGRSIGGYLTSSYDSNGGTFTKGGAVYGRTDTGFEALGFFKQADGDNYEAGNGNDVIGTGADLQSILGKLAYESTGGHRFELSGEQVHDDTIRPFRANIGKLTNRANTDRPYDMKRQNLVFNYATTHNEGMWNPKLVLGYNSTELGVPNDLADVVYSTGETTSLSGKAENSFIFSPGDSLTVGADFYDDEASYKDLSTDIAEQATNIGIYAQARLTPVEALRLSAGLRGDKQWFEGTDGTEIDHAGLSGNVAVAYDVIETVTLKAGYSNVFGGVALAENFIMNKDWIYAGGIKAIRSNNVTLGAEFRQDGFTFGAGVFRSRFKDARNEVYSIRGEPVGVGADLTTDFETQGYSLSAGYSWGPGFVRLSFTDTEFTIGDKAGDSDAGQYLGTPIGRVVAVEAGHRFDAIGLAIGGTIDAAFENKDTAGAETLPLGSYQAVGLYAEYQPPMADFLTLRIEGNNLLDETYADRATYGQEFGNVVPLYEPGRSVLVKATVHF
ncbi:TonB-dependent receptor [Tistrella sp. BH-R2-4]|uniref:TonB-dependent receptor n=1 Tax=Tistrella arctica TaxID=3133430 RepID=A0ABU9YNG4_9PROT